MSIFSRLRTFFEPEEASLTEIRRREMPPVGRTVPAELAKRPPSEMTRCACGAFFRPRAEASLCLTCERGDDPVLGTLIVRRPAPKPAEVLPVVLRFRKERGG